MDLIRDILDAPLVDQNGRNIGRVDGIVLQLRTAAPPRFVAMETGAITLARRIHPRLARWCRAVALKISPVPIKPVRILPRALSDIGTDIEVDVDPRLEMKLLRAERWLKRHVISRLPAGKRGTRS